MGGLDLQVLTARYRPTLLHEERMTGTAKSRQLKRLLPLFGVGAIGIAMSTAAWFYVSAFDEKIALKAFYQEAT